ncbi:MAG: HAMP domain-containing sensor histidine kinase [Lachnospiraceae bacterium]|nr:HAMP domain-containing sensor histidine kinase [Lachnospiraceae bacterium]MDD3796178.1 HAMP domain-containing sensor histidine kinase [Lachnospiraceae bacterium]
MSLLKFGILENYETQTVNQRAATIRSQCQLIVSQLCESDYIRGQASDLIESELSQLGALYSGRVVIVNGNFRIIKDTYGIDEDKVIVAEEVIQCFQGTDTTNYNRRDEFLEVTVPVRDSVTKDMTGAMIISVPTTDIREGKEALSSTVLVLQIALTLVVLAVAFYVARLLVKPFGKVTASMEEMQGSFMEEEISIPDYTETRLLSEAYNRMLKRMKVQEDSRQEFVSNVSHELKTPLTSMKVLADSLLAQEEVPNELYKEFMGDIAEEIDRENKIITDLLSLVKMDKKSSDITIKETNINDLIELILKRLRPIAAKREIELVLDSFKPILAEVDETKLTLALSNLVENGIKYNKEKGWVHVSLNIDNKFFYVKVEDSGMGIPQEDQENIFERFYRVDKSHSREIGGTGLGLAITRSAVLMHHGAVRVYSKEGEGTTFTVRIPLKYVP